MRRQAAIIAGKRRETGSFDVISSPFDGAPVSEVPLCVPEDVDVALEGAFGARRAMRKLPAHERARLCEGVAARLTADKETIALLIARESGKPIRYARAEVDRGAMTFTLAAGVARTLGGELLPADVSPRGEGKLLAYRRVPRGVVAAISPANFPLNLAAHKLAPALAVGAPIVLKPPHQAPSAGLVLGEILHELGVPSGGVSTLHARPEVAELLARDRRVAVLSFTGSDRVGYHLKSLDPRKHVLLELGGNAPVIVDDGVNLERLMPGLVDACWSNAGQVCIKAQRLFVHVARFEEFLARFVEATRAVACGDPLDEATVVGPLIERRHVERVLGLIREAEAAGARVLTGGQAAGSVVEPTVLVGAAPELPVCRDEVFGPVTTVEPFSDFGDAIRRANASRFGLQASVYTENIGRALAAFDELEYGGVLVNEPTTLRIDNYPYGGTKDSGSGREGVRFAAEEFTETRVLVLSP
jgi:acyl-CoA reductase-like NAD-dependent aldehyde dehydrogenase